MATPRTVVTQGDVTEMAGAIAYFLHGQGEASFAHMLPQDDYDLLVHTQIDVMDAATPRDIKAAGTPPDALLLGLYTFPPAKIQVFAAGVIAAKHDPVDVFEHELGHRFGFNHSSHPAATAQYLQNGTVQCTSFHPEATTPTGWPDTGEAPTGPASDEACPFCRLHARTAEVAMLLDGLRRRAWLAAQPTLLPLGLGGTIPLMRRKLTDAHDALLEAAVLFPDRKGEVRDLDRLLHTAQERLAGHITTEQVTPAWEAAYAAWNAAYSLNHAYILHTKYPTAGDIHDLV